jgi:5'(3')-deoxyribonucleotidase
MDGVIADFDAAVKYYDPTLETDDHSPNYDQRYNRVNEICEKNPRIFQELPIIRGSKLAIEELFPIYNIYFLSTPMWNVPESFMDKRLWLEQHFGEIAYKRLILTHNKGLNHGDFLVDDRTWNGVKDFKGHHIHFGTPEFPDWLITTDFLKRAHKI